MSLPAWPKVRGVARLATFALLPLVVAAAAAASTPRGNGLIAYVPGPPERSAEIWTVRSDGTGSRLLTRGAEPAWSPDGTRIAFSRGGEIVVAAAHGSDERVLGHGGAPAWSPDGSWLVVSRSAPTAGTADRDLWVIGVDGGEAQLTSGAGRDDAPSWSPDGTQIAFERDGAIWIVAADGTDPRALVGAGGFERSPRFSPDGSLLAFERNGGVFTIATDGGAERRVSPPQLWSLGPAWSPDGTRIAFFAGGAVCTARLDGSDPRRVTFDNFGETTYDVGSRPPSWQPTSGTSGPDSPYSCSDPRWDLEVSITTNRARARVGDVAVFRILVRNHGPDPATQTRVGVALPEESDLIATSLGRGSCEESRGGTLVSFRSCDPGLLFPGEQAQFTFSAILRAPGPQRASAEQPIYGSPRDDRGENDSARVTVVVSGCTITGTFGADVLRGTSRDDVICALDGDDVVRGLGGRDQIWGGRGADLVEGGPGADRLLGGSGPDDLDAGHGHDVAWGGFGRDRIVGGQGDDRLHGGERGGRRVDATPYWDEADRIDGGRGADLVEGGVGPDRLFAGAGDDVVLSRDAGGVDVAACGRGRDRLLADPRDRRYGCERVSMRP